MRNRLFLFASYSGLRQRESAFKRSARVPTAAQRLGDYSLSTVTIRDPLTRAPFRGNRIPANRIDPVARRITDEWVPPANLPGDFAEVHEPQPYTNDEGLIRWDAYFRGNHHQVPAAHHGSGLFHALHSHCRPESRQRLLPAQGRAHAGQGPPLA